MARVETYSAKLSATCSECEDFYQTGEMSLADAIDTRPAVRAAAKKHTDKTGHRVGIIHQEHQRVVRKEPADA